MENGFCYCCSVASKFSRIDYLDIETRPLISAAKRSPTNKNCYMKFCHYVPHLLPGLKAANAKNEELIRCSAPQSKLAISENLPKSNSTPQFRISGNEETNQHVCRICENSETVKITENCLFENFDDFTQHMSRLHNTSVIRITTRPTNLRAESDNLSKREPEVSICNKALSNVKNIDEKCLGQGAVKQKLYRSSSHTNSTSSNTKLVNENYNNRHCSDPNRVPAKQLHIKDNGSFDLCQEYVYSTGRSKDNLMPIKNQKNENRRSLTQELGAKKSYGLVRKMEGGSSSEIQSFPTHFASETSQLKSNYEENLDGRTVAQENCKNLAVEHFEVKKVVSQVVETIVERAEMKDNQACGIVNGCYENIKYKSHESEIATTGESSIKISNCIKRETNVETKGSANDVTYRNKDLENALRKALKENGFLPNVDRLSSKGLSKKINTGRSQTKSKNPFEKDKKLISTTNYRMVKDSLKGGNNILINNSNPFGIPLLPRKRGRPPKNSVPPSTSHSQISETNSLNLILSEDGRSARKCTYNNSNDKKPTQLEKTEDCIKNNNESSDLDRLMNSGNKSETTVMLLQKHIINRQMFNETNNSSQNHRFSIPGSSNKGSSKCESTSSLKNLPRLSDRLKLHKIATKELSEHLKKVKFLSNLGLVETSCLSKYILDRKCSNKNGSVLHKSTKSTPKNGITSNKSLKRVATPSLESCSTEPPPKRGRGRPPKNMATQLKKVSSYKSNPDHELIFVPVSKNRQHNESTRSTGRARKTSQKYSDYVCYY